MSIAVPFPSCIVIDIVPVLPSPALFVLPTFAVEECPLRAYAE